MTPRDRFVVRRQNMGWRIFDTHEPRQIVDARLHRFAAEQRCLELNREWEEGQRELAASAQRLKDLSLKARLEGAKERFLRYPKEVK